MTSLATYRNGNYNQFDASDEIIAAIERIAGDDILDDDSEAYRIWAEPSDAEMAKVKSMAFGLSAAESLFWGGTEIKRQ